ncbi:MAG: glycosyltransferase [Chloroflexota bacterium]
MEPKRIALYLPLLALGGAERSALILLDGFRREGFLADLVLSKKAGPLLEEVPPGIRIVDLGKGRMLTSIFSLANYLRKEQPAALISGLDIANIIVIWARLLSRSKARLLLVTHSQISSLVADSTARLQDRLYPFLLRTFFRHADGMMAVSEGVANNLSTVTGIPRDKICVIHNPIPNNIADLAARQLEHPWFSTGEPPVILSVGRLTSAKDFPTLLRAFADLRQRRMARLVILGDGELDSQLKDLAKKLDITHDFDMPGMDLNPYRYMSRCHVFALSSTFEGFGRVLVEALVCGAQVVSTDCPSGPAEILDHGRFGRLVPVGDPGALAQAIEESLDHPLPAELLRERARDFSAAAAVKKYLSLLGLD